mmetsp:Transcript_24174/g.24102  ORF Transcript_24174/g.24102 Transcript_24174/m.24102 type:complete len:101 (-) Transcript_24174:186-488(-)
MDEEIGVIGLIIYANKQIEKEKKNFDKKDERLGQTLAFLARVFFKIKNAELTTRSIEDKNWKMSELVDQSLTSASLKEYIEIIQCKAPEFYKVERVNIYM